MWEDLSYQSLTKVLQVSNLPCCSPAAKEVRESKEICKKKKNPGKLWKNYEVGTLPSGYHIRTGTFCAVPIISRLHSKNHGIHHACVLQYMAVIMMLIYKTEE